MLRLFCVFIVIFTTWNHVDCQLGQFGFPFLNNLNQNAQSSFNPQNRQQGSFTFGGGDWVFPNFDTSFNPWSPPPRTNKPSPQTNYNYNNNNNRPLNNNQNQQYRPQPTTPVTTTRRTGGVLQSNRVGGRISQTKCEEYSKLVKKAFQVASLSLTSDVQSVNVNKCDYASTGLIVGGEDARLNEFPHMAAIGYKNFNDEDEWNCAGSLISDRFVLSAAHCEQSNRLSPSTVRLGEHNLAVQDRGSPEIDIPIEKFIAHEKYNRETKENDIAVIKMVRSVPFSRKIRPACLPDPAIPNQKPKAVATGWGFTEVGGQTADILQKVQLTIISNEKCRNVYNDIENYQVYPSQMCAGELVGGKDTCGGDSGGPLQVTNTNNECIFTVIGITSYGSTFCGAKNSPGIYTRTSSYIDWIEKQVWL